MKQEDKRSIELTMELLERYKCLLRVQGWVSSVDDENLRRQIRESNRARLGEIDITLKHLEEMLKSDTYREKMFTLQMNDVVDNYNDFDLESGHIEADNLLVDFIERNGHTELANAYKKVDKWYA